MGLHKRSSSGGGLQRVRLAKWTIAALSVFVLSWAYREAISGCNPPLGEGPTLISFSVEEVGVSPVNKVTVTPTSNPDTLYICEGSWVKMDATVSNGTEDWIGWRMEKQTNKTSDELVDLTRVIL